MTPGPVLSDPLDRLRAKLLVPTDPAACWGWRGALTPSGYGSIAVKTAKGWRPARAHRLAYELLVGPIPEGLHVLHHCDHPPCCNPVHLYLGTHDDNMRDMAKRGRATGGTVRGESHSRAKLSDAQVAEVRAACAAGQTQRAVAAYFGITQPAVSSIVTGRTRVTAAG